MMRECVPPILHNEASRDAPMRSTMVCFPGETVRIPVWDWRRARRSGVGVLISRVVRGGGGMCMQSGDTLFVAKCFLLSISVTTGE